MNSNHISPAHRPLTAAQKQNWYAAKIEAARESLAEAEANVANLRYELEILCEYAAKA